MVPGLEGHTRNLLWLQAMNYHKYVSLPKPVRSKPTGTSGSGVQHDGNSASSSSAAVGVPVANGPQSEGTAVTSTPVSDTCGPAVNGIKKEPGVSGDAGGLQANGAGSSQDQGPKPRKVRSAKKKTRPKSMFRLPLTGELAQRLYTMPPLPPTTSTLSAFKSLLLDRLRLLRLAGAFRVDSVLGIPKELEQELNPEATKSASKPGTTDAGTSTGPSGTPSSSSAAGSIQVPHTAAKTVAPECDNIGKYNPMPIIRSELHAEHWMKTIRNTHNYQMLRSRFLSLFLWPSLLSSVRVKDQNAESEESSDKRAATVASLLGSGRLVVDTNEVDEDENDPTPTAPVKVWKLIRPQYRSVKEIVVQ